MISFDAKLLDWEYSIWCFFNIWILIIFRNFHLKSAKCTTWLLPNVCLMEIECQELYIVCSWDWDEGRCSIYCKGVRYVLRLLGFQLQVTTWRKKSGDKRLTSTRLFGKICQLHTHSAQIKEQLDKYNTHGIDRIDRSFDWVDEWMGPRLKRKSIQAPPRVFLSVLPVCSCLLKNPRKCL